MLTIVVSTLLAATTPGCFCDEDWSPFEQQVRNALQHAEYVAIVEISSTARVVVSREEYAADLNHETGETEHTVRLVNQPLLVAHFNPLRIWKGDETATTLETPADPQNCGMAFVAGSQYLVYAYGPDDDGRIATGRCTRTARLEESSQDIVLLDRMLKTAAGGSQRSDAEKRFREALDLIHSYSGESDELVRAMNEAESLSLSDPASGYSQALLAEAFSTWELGLDGKPVELRAKIIALADDALRLNPDLAQAHVAKARVYARAALLLEAETEIAEALAIDPQEESAIFQQAEIYRRAGNLAKSETWYQNFIAATSVPARKSNGYYWLGRLFQDIGSTLDGPQRDVYLMRARLAYQQMVDLDPGGAWKLVNFASFLNGYAADFDAAETYAQRALSVMEFQMARFHLAAARYQKLQAGSSTMNVAALQAAIAGIAEATQVSLDEAVAFRGFAKPTILRLTELRNRSM